MTRVPAAVWRVTGDLLVALDTRFGEPLDAYVNGSQVWMREDGPAGEALEWRLHPVPGYRRPHGLGTYEVFQAVALALGTGEAPPAEPRSLWEGLEVFPAYGDELEPSPLVAAAVGAIGIVPDASGMVDHEPVADAWERSGGRTSIVEALLAQIGDVETA